MRSSCILILLALSASPALAQTAPAAPKPAPAVQAPTLPPPPDNRIPVAAFDLRGVFAALGQDAQSASDLFVSPTEMSSKAFGASVGAHVYPFRGESLAFGVGAEAILARNSFEPIDATTLKGTGVVYNRRLRGISGQMSLNFGHRLGWSYITIGTGPMSFESYLAKLEPDGLREMTLNYGAGARWFNTEHLAFTVDLRFYATKPSLATLTTAGRIRHNVVAISAGISIK